MQFELDDTLIDDILFHMENQDGDYVLDSEKSCVVDIFNDDCIDEEDLEDERFIALPEWSSNDGYRLMEKFAASLKNPVVRQELSCALNRSKGVFRAFKDVLEQYPETEKMWFSFKEQQMKNEVIAWYNSLREEWGLEPIGSEPEDNTSLVLEDFVIKENANPKVGLCCNASCIACDICLTAETSNGDSCGFICAEKTSQDHLHISRLEVKPEYRGMGLGKTLLAKLLEKAAGQTVTIDLPAENAFFSRILHLEGFKPCMQRYVLEKS